MENKTYLPDHYTEVNEPFFEGRGNHSVMKLEELCEGYKEYTHQLQIKFQNASLQCAELKKELEKLRNANAILGNGYHELQSENESLKKRVEEVIEDYKNLNSLSIAMQKRIRSCSELEKAHEEYIKVLLDEIDSLVGLAAVHGWRSENVDRGKECRLKIATIKEALNLK